MRNHRHRKSLSISDFEVGICAGKGRFGNVFVGKHKSSGRIVALKRLGKTEIRKENLMEQVRREAEILHRLKHPNIVRLLCAFDDQRHVYLVQEFASKGELFKHLQKAGRFTERKVSQYIRQISSAMAYMHRKGVIHRDLKPENVLVCEDGSLRLCDFGYVVKVDPRKSRRSTRCGTLDYFSPEMVKGQRYGKSVDIWALGVLTYELMVGDAPFYEKKETETLRRIKKGKIRFPSFVSPEAKDFIRRLLRTQAHLRMTAEDALRHAFITKYQ